MQARPHILATFLFLNEGCGLPLLDSVVNFPWHKSEIEISLCFPWSFLYSFRVKGFDLTVPISANSGVPVNINGVTMINDPVSFVFKFSGNNYLSIDSAGGQRFILVVIFYPKH
jgi:hypothetical protein